MLSGPVSKRNIRIESITPGSRTRFMLTVRIFILRYGQAYGSGNQAPVFIAGISADYAVKYLPGVQMFKTFAYRNDFAFRRENAGYRHQIKFCYFCVSQSFFKACELFFVSAYTFGKEYLLCNKWFVHFLFSLLSDITLKTGALFYRINYNKKIWSIV